MFHAKSAFLPNARVVKWQTRTFEGRMPQGVGVQVPPRAPEGHKLSVLSFRFWFPVKTMGLIDSFEARPMLPGRELVQTSIENRPMADEQYTEI
jgi:hypothetical protein